MTQAIETLCRLLDAANCVYEAREIDADTIHVDTYRDEFYRIAARVASEVKRANPDIMIYVRYTFSK